MSVEIALVGNQNSGKTTLFNQMTGSSLNVGNFPGTTVEMKQGIVKHHHEAEIVDLPGIYSLSPYTEEERITREYLLQSKPDVVVNVIDSTCFERSLYLTLQVIEMNFPTVLAVNMMDELRASGRHLDIDSLQRVLGIPVVPISAFRDEGIDELVKIAIDTAQNRVLPQKMDFCSGATHKAIHSIAHIIEDAAVAADLPIRFAASKIVEGDDEIKSRMALSEYDSKLVEILVEEMELRLETDRDAAIADMRYEFIEKHCCPCLKGENTDTGHVRSVKIDRVLTHRV
ncbi:MAG: FeoB small GTPase domain-containing protein, partial [Bacillota bacterium]|nr:FeoB small GTPase domain-containing protein [Bacillota bacterium]